MDKTEVVAIFVICISIVLIFALWQDINGAILGAGLTAIGTVIGYLFGYGRSQNDNGDNPRSRRKRLLGQQCISLPYHRYGLYEG